LVYHIVFSNKASKQLSKLDKEVQKRITAALERLQIRPEAHITKLVDDPGYKFRVGDYRLILDIEEERILILKIGHRKNIYKNL